MLVTRGCVMTGKYAQIAVPNAEFAADLPPPLRSGLRSCESQRLRRIPAVENHVFGGLYHLHQRRTLMQMV